MQIKPDAWYGEMEASLILEMFDWLKGKGISARQAIRVIDGLRAAIVDARKEETEKIML